MITFSKGEIAMIQLSDAIKLYNANQHVSAITLAGAAEEIFAGLLMQEAERKCISLSTAEHIEQFMFESTPGLITEKNYHVQRSRTRNELKHHDNQKSHNSVTGDFAGTALNHIAGAIINYKMANGRIPGELVIQEFCLRHGIS